MQRIRGQLCNLCCLAVASLIAADGAAATVEAQRTAFRAAYAAAELGNWEPATRDAKLLKSYVLWPDLRAAYLRTRLGKDGNRDERAIRAFLDQYGSLKPARELRYRYALELGRQRRDEDFLALYREFYADLGEASLDCLAVHANIRLGRVDDVADRAERLWLVGRSQVDQCDPVFAYLRRIGGLTTALHQERYALAVEQQQFMLARYLARSIDEAHLDAANRWLRAQGNPQEFLRQADVRSADSVYHEQLAYAARRLAFTDPEQALEHWSRLGRSIRFGDAMDHGVRRHAALWAARLNLPKARVWLDRLDAAAVDREVRRWQIRSALRDRDWPRVVQVIESLEGREAERQVWRYWRGVALLGSGREADGMLVLSSLARERSYHGFLAADQLGVDYAFSDVAASADETVITRLSATPALIRARELYRVGLDGRARSEWDAAVSSLKDDEKTQAAILAQRWGWHSRAIAVAAQAGQFDDLGLRYPLAHREAFRRSSSETGIRESWAYGIARSESLFMRDVRSSAGAVGVMQLMPSTGRTTAREIRHPYRGRATLIDPASNIRLGTTYLRKMNDRFDQHPALATAAYNAGPRRVVQWLSGAGPIDARVWIETIPYSETRDYVRRVLASDVIFHWRLTGQTQRLSTYLRDIIPAAATARAVAQ